MEFLHQPLPADIQPFILKNIDNPFQTQLALMKLRRKFDMRIEPHAISETDFNASNPFVNKILASGIEIKNEA